ncbi:hypothetical protein P3S68_029390 [Capsicum galapagoense]
MGRKNVIPKWKDDTAGSSRKRRAAAVEKVSKRKKIEESVSELDSELKEISDYVNSSEDVAKRSVSGDSEECEGSGSNSDDGDNDSLSVPYLSKCIFMEWYDLRTIIDEVGSFPANISVRSRMAAYREFKQIFVDQELKKRFKQSYFGHLRNLPEHLLFNGQLVHYLLLRCVKNDKMRHKMWFCINNKPTYFGLKYFCLITGLNCSLYSSESKMKKVLAKGDNFCFKVTKNKNITVANLLHLIRGNKLNEDQKLSTMVLAHHVACKRFDEGCRYKTDSNGRLFEFLREVSMREETFQLTMDYLKKKNDLKKQKEVFDEKQKIWIYEAFPHLGEFAGKSMDEPLSIPRILRWHTSKSDKIIEGDPFKYKGKVTENVHRYIIPTVRETKMDYMIMFEPYTDEVKNNILDGLKKELEGVTVLTSNEDSDDNGDLGGNTVGVRVGDDDSSSTSKYTAGTSSPGDLYKRVAALEEAVLDIAAYIKEKRMKKKKNDERQHERVHVHESKKNKEGEKKSKMDELAAVVAEEEKREEKKDGEEDKSQEEGGKVAATAEEEEAAVDEQRGAEKGKTVEEADKADKEEVEKEGVEEKETKKAAVDTHAEKEGEEDENEEAATIVEKKEVEAVQTNVVMDIVDEINSNTCVYEELRERDI